MAGSYAASIEKADRARPLQRDRSTARRTRTCSRRSGARSGTRCGSSRIAPSGRSTPSAPPRALPGRSSRSSAWATAAWRGWAPPRDSPEPSMHASPDESLTDERAEAEGEFVERLFDNGINRGFIVIAPHGGDIERRTDDQAVCVLAGLHDRAVSGWLCRGWSVGGGAFRHWHITSTDLHEASFPKLARVIGRRFRFAVAFHGFDDDETLHDVLLGGIAPDPLKLEVKAAIEAAVPSLDGSHHATGREVRRRQQAQRRQPPRRRRRGDPDRAEAPRPYRPRARRRRSGRGRVPPQAAAFRGLPGPRDRALPEVRAAHHRRDAPPCPLA